MTSTNITGRTKAYHPRWLTLLRIALGLVILWKAIVFIRATAQLEMLIEQTGIGLFSENAKVLSLIVAYLGLLCGLFIACGLFTRASCIIQIPILLVAVFFVNIKNIGTSTFELILSVAALVLLFLFAKKGGGNLSADEFFRSYYKAGTEEGNTKKFFE